MPLEALATAQVIRVVGADGTPVAGATVEAYESLIGDEGPVAVRVTGADGSAALDVRADRSHWVRAALGVQASTPQQLDGLRTTLLLEPARDVTGAILMPDGTAAASARVWLTLRNEDRELAVAGRADGSGRFDVPALPESWLGAADAIAVGWCNRTKTFSTPWCSFRLGALSTGSITLLLGDVHVRGRVVGADGAPLAGARVFRVSDPGEFRWWSIASGEADRVTGPDGEFSFRLPAVGDETFAVVAGGHAPFLWRPEAATNEETVITLSRGGPLAGRVDGPDGHPKARAWVCVVHPLLPNRPIEIVSTDEEGRFRFDLVGAGALEIRAKDFPAYDLQPSLVVPDVRAGADLRLVLPDPICGTIRWAGDVRVTTTVRVIARDARGTEVAGEGIEPLRFRREVVTIENIAFAVWEQGEYEIDLQVNGFEPARVRVFVAWGHENDVRVGLKPCP